MKRCQKLVPGKRLSLGCRVRPILQRVPECRDPNDDSFLEAALKGKAEVIIPGDADLLALHPWHSVQFCRRQIICDDHDGSNPMVRGKGNERKGMKGKMRTNRNLVWKRKGLGRTWGFRTLPIA